MNQGRRGFLAALALASPAAAEVLERVGEVKSVEFLSADPESIIVLSFPEPLCAEAYQSVRQGLKSTFESLGMPEQKLMILDGGITLQVIQGKGADAK
jgi:hypothetical protein